MTKWQVTGLYIVWIVLGTVICAILARGGNVFVMVGYVVWIAVGVLWGRYINNKRNAALDHMWALADQLGFTAATLKRMQSRYGLLDIELTRPEKRQFMLNANVTANLSTRMEQMLKHKNNDSMPP